MGLGCTVEMIDAFIAEHGVTECSSSSGGPIESTSTTDTSGSSNESAGSGSTSGEEESSTSSGEDTSTGAEITGTADTTGLPPEICGNGIVEGEESCDDGNQIPGDGCQECARDSLVFISSEDYAGNELGGLWGADQRCRNLAAKAGVPRALTFKAWLSTASMSATDRLIHSPGRYLLVNGLVVAQNWGALTSGSLENPIMVDELSMSRENAVWTGTLANGDPAPGTDFCGDWDAEFGLNKSAGFGVSTSIDATWSFFDNVDCLSAAHIYCIEQ
jgi:cysteine-rich repeat protein